MDFASLDDTLRSMLLGATLRYAKREIETNVELMWISDALGFWCSDGGGHNLPVSDGLLDAMESEGVHAINDPEQILWIDEALNDPCYADWRIRAARNDEAFQKWLSEQIETPERAPAIQSAMRHAAVAIRAIK